MIMYPTTCSASAPANSSCPIGSSTKNHAYRGFTTNISAQGLMSGRILAAIPAAVAALMFVVNTRYAWFFVDDPVGHELLAGALALQVVGYMIIKKIVTIEV